MSPDRRLWLRESCLMSAFRAEDAAFASRKATFLKEATVQAELGGRWECPGGPPGHGCRTGFQFVVDGCCGRAVCGRAVCGRTVCGGTVCGRTVCPSPAGCRCGNPSPAGLTGSAAIRGADPSPDAAGRRNGLTCVRGGWCSRDSPVGAAGRLGVVCGAVGCGDVGCGDVGCGDAGDCGGGIRMGISTGFDRFVSRLRSSGVGTGSRRVGGWRWGVSPDGESSKSSVESESFAACGSSAADSG